MTTREDLHLTGSLRLPNSGIHLEMVTRTLDILGLWDSGHVLRNSLDYEAATNRLHGSDRYRAWMSERRQLGREIGVA